MFTFPRYAHWACLLMFALSLAACSESFDVGDDDEMKLITEYGDPIDRDFDALDDTLRVLTMYNSTSYFLYRGEPMGHEYEMLRQFAKTHDLVLKTTVVTDRDSLFLLLNQGVGDVAAARVIPAVADSANIAFTDAIFTTSPVLVQRIGDPSEALPETADSLLNAGPPTEGEPDRRSSTASAVSEPDPAFADLPKFVEVNARPVTDLQDLSEQRVHLRDNSPYYERLIEVEDAITGDIYIIELEDASSVEKVIRLISSGEIEFTVAPEALAELKASYYGNIKITPTIGEEHSIAWAVRTNAPALREALDEWIENNPGFRENMYQKYFVDRRGYRERIEDTYLANETGQLSRWDQLFQRYAPNIDWDWRLLAAQAFQESRFKPRAKSWAGAMGLLQLMPGTARDVDVADPYDPDENVAGAVRYLDFLEGYWADKIDDAAERQKFILASYNAGFGHVEDARRLTEKYGGDTDIWNDVAYWMLQKSKAKYYRDPVVKYGFVRGLEPVTYVAKILDRYDHYRQFVDPAAPTDAPASETISAVGNVPD